MAVKNFVFRENWIGSKVVGMKTTFFAIFNPTWTHMLLPIGPNKESLNKILVKKDRSCIIVSFVTLRLTN